jgi:predicted nucleotidyltransferase
VSVTTRHDLLLERLRQAVEARRGALAARGVRELSLVGSRARGAAGPSSDVDLLMDLAPDATFGLLDLVALKDELGQALGVEVDVVFKSRLRPYVAERITRDVVRLL